MKSIAQKYKQEELAWLLFFLSFLYYTLFFFFFFFFFLEIWSCRISMLLQFQQGNSDDIWNVRSSRKTGTRD
jgi:hypothetical protein